MYITLHVKLKCEDVECTSDIVATLLGYDCFKPEQRLIIVKGT